MSFFSIIIPIYNNKEKEMTDCFASISQQQYKDFEVIVVDDGSNETCAKNIDYLSKKFFTRYRVIHTANNGVSKARNLGIKYATGNYIAFADGDDIVCPCMLMDAYQVLQKYDLDILYGMTQCMNEGELCIRKQDRCLPVSVDFLDRKGQNELYCHMFNVSRDRFKCGKRYVSRGPIARVVKKSLAEQNLFDEKLAFGEDEEWNLRLLSNPIQAGVIKKLWYYYIQRKNSTLHRFRNDFIKKHEERLSAMWKYVRDDKTEQSYMSETLHMLKDVLYHYYFSDSYGKSKKEASNEFYSLITKFPWNAGHSIKNAIHLNLKGKVLYILLRSKLLFVVCHFISSMRLYRSK